MKNCSNCEHRIECVEDGRLIEYTQITDLLRDEHAMLKNGRMCPLDYRFTDSFEVARRTEIIISGINQSEDAQGWKSMEQFMGELILRLESKNRKGN